ASSPRNLLSSRLQSSAPPERHNDCNRVETRLLLAAGEVEGPAPHDDAGQGEEDERPDPVRREVPAPHGRTVLAEGKDVRSGRLRSGNAEPRRREPRRPAHASSRDREPDRAAARLPHPPGLEAGGPGARRGDPGREGAGALPP